jgi:hypothetical protein
MNEPLRLTERQPCQNLSNGPHAIQSENKSPEYANTFYDDS